MFTAVESRSRQRRCELVGEQSLAAAATTAQAVQDLQQLGVVDLDAVLDPGLALEPEDQLVLVLRARAASPAWSGRRSRWCRRRCRCRSGSSRGPAAVRRPRRRAPAASPPARGPARSRAGPPAACARTAAPGRTSACPAWCASRGGRGTAVRPASSVPTAWMCPLGYGEIHTSCQAGGIASDLIRWISSASVIRGAGLVEETQPEPARRREKPLVLGETVLSRGMRRQCPNAARRMPRFRDVTV